MSNPKWQAYFLPILKVLADKAEHSFLSLEDDVARLVGLSESDRLETDNTDGPDFRTLVAWTRGNLKTANLIVYPHQGYCQITQRGLDLLAQNPTHLTYKDIQQYPDFPKFKGNVTTPSTVAENQVETIHPYQALTSAHQALRNTLAAELLQLIMERPPSFFERLVVELIVKMGYGGGFQDAGQSVGGSGDGGIDGIIKLDPLGLDLIFLQAKRYKGTAVGSPEIDGFIGALEKKKAQRGIFVTTSSFTPAAREAVTMTGKRIILIDGKRLTQLMIDYNVGVTTYETYELKQIDSGYFAGEL